jgi:hypothetical protein
MLDGIIAETLAPNTATAPNTKATMPQVATSDCRNCSDALANAAILPRNRIKSDALGSNHASVISGSPTLACHKSVKMHVNRRRVPEKPHD